MCIGCHWANYRDFIHGFVGRRKRHDATSGASPRGGIRGLGRGGLRGARLVAEASRRS